MDKEKITKHEALEDFPGAAIDSADDNKVNPRLVKEDVKDLNNNPQNNDIDE